MNVDDHSVAKFYTNLWLNAAIGGTAFITFCAAEERRLPELDEGPDREDPSSADGGFLGWIWRALWIGEAEVFDRHGEDGVMYLRFLRLCFFLCLAMMVTGCVIILPINITAPDDDRSQRQEMGVLTTSNIPKGSDRFMAHIAFTYVYSFLFYGAIMWAFKRYLALRNRYFAANCARAYTLLLRNIPGDLLSKNVIQRWFEARLNASVVAVNFVWKTDRLDALQKRRRKLQRKLEKAEMQAHLATVYTRNRLLELFGEKVNGTEFYRQQIEQLEREIGLMQQHKSRHMKKADAGFVTLSTATFNRMKMAAFTDPTAMTISPAPGPSDVNWKQVDTDYVSHLLRMTIITLVLLVISLGWAIPQTFIVSLANLSTLQQVSGLGWVADSVTSGLGPTGVAILEGFVPAVAISLQLTLVKILFKMAYVRLGGLSSYSIAEWYAMIMYSFFLFFNVFLVVTVEGTFFLALEQIINDPSELVSLLASSLPQQALFFTVFIMVHCVGRLPFKLLRVVRLIQCGLKFLFLARPITPSERRELLTAGDFDFVSGYSNGLLIFTLTLCYSLMAPLISVFGFLFFALSLVIEGYNLQRATEQRWQGGGKAFSFVLHHLMISFIVFQLLMIGVLGLSEYAGGVALVPLPFLTAGLWFVLHFGWSHVIDYGPVESAGEIRRRDSVDEERMAHAYRQPSLAPLDHELQDAVESKGALPRKDEEGDEEEEDAKILSAELEIQHLRFTGGTFTEPDENEGIDHLGLSVHADR